MNICGRCFFQNLPSSFGKQLCIYRQKRHTDTQKHPGRPIPLKRSRYFSKYLFYCSCFDFNSHFRFDDFAKMYTKRHKTITFTIQKLKEKSDQHYRHENATTDFFNMAAMVSSKYHISEMRNTAL